jgi:hypothetical protein
MRLVFIAIAVVLFGVAFFWATQPPNMASGMAAFGFALAGGMSLIAAAIVKGKSDIVNKP